MPPYGTYGLPPQQGRAPQFQQPYQPMTQSPSPQYGGYGGGYGSSMGSAGGYIPQPPMPYGPPPAQPGSLYGAAPPGTLANTPPDPYAWQHGAMQPTNGARPMPPQYQYPTPTTAMPAYAQPAPVQQFQAPPQPQYYGQTPPATPYQQGAYFQQNLSPGAGGMAQQTPMYQAYQQGQRQRRAMGRPKLDLRMFVARLLYHPKQSMIAGGVAAGAVILVVGLTVAANSGGSKQSSSSISILGGSAGKLTSGEAADQLFETALGNAFQTKSYDQKVTSTSQTVERMVDVSNIKSPKLTGSAKVTDTGTDFQAYATRDDTFVKLSKGSILAGKPSMANRWVQVRRGGALLDTTGTGGASLDLLFTPSVALYNGFIFGNYSAQDRSALMDIIKNQLVYRYDPSAVKQTNLNGQPVLQYEVTVSSSGQEALSAKAAQLAGVDQGRISQAAVMARLSGSANIKLIVSVSSHDQRIMQIVEEGGGDAATTEFSAYDATKLSPSQPPKPEYVWDDYAKRLK